MQPASGVEATPQRQGGTPRGAAGAGAAERSIQVSIIIPALDEALTLPICLQSLLNQDFAGSMRVIIVDNGSTDGTPDVARSWSERFRAAGHELCVVQIPQRNKPAALNAGDAIADGASRIYLDADIEISPNCVSAVVAAFQAAADCGMCCAKMQIAPARSWVTRRYARVWSQLPWVSGDVIGSGFYAISAAQRKRWGDFPNLIADDGWAQAQFRRHERRVLPEAHFTVRLPEGLRNMVNVRTRWVRGNRQLAQFVGGGGDVGRTAFPIGGRLWDLFKRPGLWIDLPLYFLINSCAAWRARRRDALGTALWERGRPGGAAHCVYKSSPAHPAAEREMPESSACPTGD